MSLLVGTAICNVSLALAITQNDWCNVDLCIEQGRLLSPYLFSLFFKNLSDEIKSLGKGVPFDNEKLSISLYADDMII